jgi:hypothetical protein
MVICANPGDANLEPSAGEETPKANPGKKISPESLRRSMR